MLFEPVILASTYNSRRFDPSLPPNRRPTLRGCEEIELTDVDGSPSPHPSPAGRGRSSGVTCTCISYSTKKMHGQVTLTARPLPRRAGRGEGVPAASDSTTSSHPLRVKPTPRTRIPLATSP